MKTSLFSLYESFLFFFLNYLRVIIVTETFREGVMVYFELSDLCGEQEEGNERV